MSLAIVVDMNLSQEWVTLLSQAGWPAVHWSSVGAIDAEDVEIMSWGTLAQLSPSLVPPDQASCKSAPSVFCQNMSATSSWQP